MTFYLPVCRDTEFERYSKQTCNWMRDREMDFSCVFCVRISVEFVVINADCEVSGTFLSETRVVTTFMLT